MLAPKITKAVIPAAGLGTRFLPATKASPKEMLPLVDKPLIQYVVEEAVNAGIRQLIVVTGRGKRAIEDHFDASFELEENLRASGKSEMLREMQRIADLADFAYVRQRHPRGLGHAILCARHLVGDEPFAVLLGDDIIDAPVSALGQMLKAYEQLAAPIVGIQQVARREVRQYGIIKPRRNAAKGAAPPLAPNLYRVEDLVEKPPPEQAPSRLAVVGRYILPGDIFEVLAATRPGKNGEIQLTDALRVLASRGPMYGCLLEGKRHDAGDKLGFLQATVEFGLKNPELGKRFHRYLKGLRL
jgi:UTP--glucose-1-phosphate uridylyltransferase